MTRSAYHGYDTDVFGGIPPLTVRHSMPKDSAIWKNRITGYADVPPDQLMASPANFRRHPKNQQDAFLGVVDDVGFVDPVLVQQSTGMVLDGHLRVELALRTNQPTIPVKYVDLTDAEAALVLATFDPISALAFADASALDELLREVSTSDAAVMQMLSDLAADNGVVPEFDAMEHWQGMPEFEQEDQTPVKQILVSFATEADLDRFARLVEQDVRMTTKSIWYPRAAIIPYKDKAYIEEETDAA